MALTVARKNQSLYSQLWEKGGKQMRRQPLLMAVHAVKIPKLITERLFGDFIEVDYVPRHCVYVRAITSVHRLLSC